MSDESSVPDEREESAPAEPAETDRPRRPGLEVARELLASARAEARRRGFRPGGTPAARTGRGDEPGARRRRPVDDTRSGAHPDERDPQVLGSALGRLVADRGWETDAAVGGVMGRWAAIVGDQVAEHARPLAFDDGELVVAADTTAWATQIRLLAPTLLARLADELGAGVVTSVVVRGPGGPSWKRGRLAVRGRGPRDTYG